MYYFLINAKSGNGKGGKAWKQVERALRRKGIDYRAAFTEDAHEAAHYMNVVKQGNIRDIRGFVVIGGDGTVQSVVQELAYTDIPLGIIPAGSGNDFARGLNMPLKPLEAMEALLSAPNKRIDLLKVDDRLCVTVVGIGIDGTVAYEVNRSPLKRWFNAFRLGTLAYVFSLLKVLASYRTRTVALRLDNGETVIVRDVWLIAAANFTSYGGGMNICPRASASDGLMDVCVVSGVGRGEFVRVFPQVFRGTHVSHPAVSMYQARCLKVASTSPMMAHGDGELLGETPLAVEVAEQALRVLYRNV